MRHASQESVASLQEINVHQGRVHVEIIIRDDVSLHLGKRTCYLHSHGSASHYDYIEQLLALLFRGTSKCSLQVAEYGISQTHCLGYRFHRDGSFLDVFVSIEIGGSTSGEYEIIVFYFADGSLQYLLVGKYGSCFSHAEEEVLALAENLTEREGDRAGVDTCRCYLIDKRRKLMKVVLVDQYHLQVCLAEFFCQFQTAKSATYDNYSLKFISLDINAHTFMFLMIYGCKVMTYVWHDQDCFSEK